MLTILTIILFFFCFKLDFLCTNNVRIDTHTGQTNHFFFFRINLWYLFTVYPIYSVVQKNLSAGWLKMCCTYRLKPKKSSSLNRRHSDETTRWGHRHLQVSLLFKGIVQKYLKWGKMEKFGTISIFCSLNNLSEEKGFVLFELMISLTKVCH